MVFGPGGFNPGYEQPFDNYGPPPPHIVGRPPYGRPPRSFGNPMMRGLKILSQFFRLILLHFI